MTRFTVMLKQYLAMHEISGRQLARETGMSVATAHRILKGKNCELDNYAKLLTWLGEEHRYD